MISPNEKVGRRFLFAGEDVQREVVAHLTFQENSWLIEFPDAQGAVIATAVLSGRIPTLPDTKTMVSELFASFGKGFCSILAGALHVQFLTLVGAPVPDELDV